MKSVIVGLLATTMMIGTVAQARVKSKTKATKPKAKLFCTTSPIALKQHFIDNPKLTKAFPDQIHEILNQSYWGNGTDGFSIQVHGKTKKTKKFHIYVPTYWSSAIPARLCVTKKGQILAKFSLYGKRVARIQTNPKNPKRIVISSAGEKPSRFSRTKKSSYIAKYTGSKDSSSQSVTDLTRIGR